MTEICNSRLERKLDSSSEPYLQLQLQRNRIGSNRIELQCGTESKIWNPESRIWKQESNSGLFVSGIWSLGLRLGLGIQAWRSTRIEVDGQAWGLAGVPLSTVIGSDDVSEGGEVVLLTF